MVIYDTKNNYNGQIKGMLYLSLMDVDYLLKKYGEEELKKSVPEDYVDNFIYNLSLRKNEKMLSEQFYASLFAGIENESDERLVQLVKKEVDAGNLFTKRQLESLSEEVLNSGIAELKDKITMLTAEELYKLRSYLMVKYIVEKINEANNYVQEGYEDYIMFQYHQYKTIAENLKIIGLSSDIEESDYFRSSQNK